MAKGNSRFNKLSQEIWSDEKFRNLSGPAANGQSLFQYLVLGRHTTCIPGLFSISEQGLAADLRWPLESQLGISAKGLHEGLHEGYVKGLREAFAEVSSKGMCKADWKAPIVWLPNALLYNRPESPNVIVAWAKRWPELPECSIKSEALVRYHQTFQKWAQDPEETALGRKKNIKKHAYVEMFEKVFKEELKKAYREGLQEGLHIALHEGLQIGLHEPVAVAETGTEIEKDCAEKVPNWSESGTGVEPDQALPADLVADLKKRFPKLNFNREACRAMWSWFQSPPRHMAEHPLAEFLNWFFSHRNRFAHLDKLPPAERLAEIRKIENADFRKIHA